MNFKVGFSLGAGLMVGMIGGIVLCGACVAAGVGGYLAVKDKLRPIRAFKRKDPEA